MKLIYLNSCYSDSFAAKIRRVKRKNVCFYKTIGYAGSNNDDYATMYSPSLYEMIYNKVDFNICLAKKELKEKNLSSDFINYEKNVCICKRWLF